MVSKVKLYTKLDLLEEELKEKLLPLLENTAHGKNNFLFCVDRFNALPELKSKADKNMEELIQVGAHILSLREKLGEPTSGTIAERICWYCREWSDLDNHHRASAQGFAQQFLRELTDKEV